MKPLALLLLLLVSPAIARTWSTLDTRFATTEEIYRSHPVRVLEVSRQVALHIKDLRKKYFPFFQQSVAVSFEATGAVDALFFPAGTYQGKTAIGKDHHVIVLNPRLFQSSRLWRMVGHEFFHAVHHELAPFELDWIREGAAQNFEYDVYGAVTQSHVRAALEDSRHALEENFDHSALSQERYGNTFLFMHFLEQNCLQERAWVSVLRNSKASARGRDTLALVLAQESKLAAAAFCHSALRAMGEFTQAKLLNRRTEHWPALWPLLPSMPLAQQEALVLLNLPREQLEDFLLRLPPFLGLKLPAELGALGPEARALEELGIRLIPAPAEKALLLYKER